ncbi:hypothetical protein IWQ57_006012, partial [Coemansia nantahalensis]
AVTRSATVFVSYLAATANDCAREAGHKTITTTDVTKALEAVGLGDFVDRLRADLDAHIQLVNDKKHSAARHKEAEDEADEEQEEVEDGDSEPDVEEDDAVQPAEDPMDVDDSDGEDPKRMRTE